jgi:hypothetical protein
VPRQFSGGKIVFSINVLKHSKRMNLDPYLIPYTNINSKWIHKLNVGPESIKLSDKNIGKSSMTLELATISWIWHPRNR